MNLDELNKEFEKTRFRRAVVCIKDCMKDIGYVPNEEEMEARKEFIKLCREVIKKTDR